MTPRSPVANQFVGQGWAFPVGTNATSGISLVGDDTELAQSIQLILSTAPGERPMRPEFGCNIHDLVFSPADETTAGQIAYEVRLALARWEPRVAVEQVQCRLDPDRNDTMYIDVVYRMKSTNDRRNLVFPFYTIPGEG